MSRFLAAREQKEIPVGITNDECSCAPRLGPQRLIEVDARGLVFKTKRRGVIQRDRRGEQLLRVASDRIERRLIDVAKVQSDAVADYVTVERRLAVDVGDGESEHP